MLATNLLENSLAEKDLGSPDRHPMFMRLLFSVLLWQRRLMISWAALCKILPALQAG